MNCLLDSDEYYPVQMSFCTDCGRFYYTDGDSYCAHCGCPVENNTGGRFTAKQIEALNDPIVTQELCNTEAGRWMLKEAAKEGLVKDLNVKKLLRTL